MNKDIFDIEAWGAETLHMIDEAIKQAREDAQKLTEENNRKWEQRRAMREKLIAAHGELVGLIMYRALMEKI